MPAAGGLTAHSFQHTAHGCHVEQIRRVFQHYFIARQHGGGHNRQDGVFRPAYVNAALKGAPSGHHKFQYMSAPFSLPLNLPLDSPKQ
jgi:hypothetical protein